ncbi:MAG: R3H domain-containing nucleic acid-binding protein [Silvanigrellaceae bacterium]
MNKQEFNGKTLDEALSAAARALGTDVTLISYNILPQSSGGLLSKLFQRGVRLEAWVDQSNDVQAAAREAVRQAMADAQGQQGKSRSNENNRDRGQPRERAAGKQADGNRPQQPGRNTRNGSSLQPSGRDRNRQNAPVARRDAPHRQDRTASDRGDESQLGERIQRPRFPLNSPESKLLLEELADQFIRGFDPEIQPAKPTLDFVNDEDVVVTVNAPNLESFLVRSDRLSCAFEHLFKRIAQRKFGDVGGRITLNAGTAAQQREDKLKQMALDVAEKVKENGKTITLSSKSSQERRVIHLALENMEGIATKSVGIGENRKLVVYSTNRPQRDEQRGNRNNQNGGRGRNRRGPADRGQGDGQARPFNPEATGEGTMDAAGNNQPRRNRRRGRRGGSRQGRQNFQNGPLLDNPTPIGDGGSDSSRDSEV